jgi:hypothetical protein
MGKVLFKRSIRKRSCMAVEVRWDNDDKTIILMMLVGRWTWDELEDGVLLSNDMIESSPYHVHFILDRQGGHWTPGNLLANIRRIVDLFVPNEGYTVIVMDNPIVKEMLHLFGTLNGGTGFRYRYMNTLEEARAFLAQQPPKLRGVDSSS